MNIEITPEERKSILQYFIIIKSYGVIIAGAVYNFWQDNQEYNSGVYAGNKKIGVPKPVEVVMEKILDKIDWDEFPDEFQLMLIYLPSQNQPPFHFQYTHYLPHHYKYKLFQILLFLYIP